MVRGSQRGKRAESGETEGKSAPERKSEIVDATIRIIKRDGWGRVTIRAIAAEMGLTTGVLWYYFADKSDILKAALLKALEPWRLSVEAALKQADPWAALVGMFISEGDDCEAQFHQAWPNVVSEIRQEPELWAIYRQEYGEFREGLARLIAKCQTAGQIDPRWNAGIEADRLCAVFDGVLIAIFGEPDRVTPEYAHAIMTCHLEHLHCKG